MFVCAFSTSREALKVKVSISSTDQPELARFQLRNFDDIPNFGLRETRQSTSSRLRRFSAAYSKDKGSMEVRKAADTLLRCHLSPLASLLVSASALPWQAGRQLTCRGPPPLSRPRTFIATTPKYAIRPIATTTASSPPSKHDRESYEGSKPTSINVEKAAHNLGWLQGGSTSRYGAFPQTQVQTRVPRERELTMNHGNSADDILQSVNSTFSSSSKTSTGGIDLSRMQNPPSKNRPESAVDMMSAITTMLPKPEKIPIRLSPSTGRSVAIQGNVDVARGFRLMERTCVQNSIKRDSMNQRYHERRGQKKKRMRGVRWRARFMGGFRAIVLRVKKLRKQGW